MKAASKGINNTVTDKQWEIVAKNIPNLAQSFIEDLIKKTAEEAEEQIGRGKSFLRIPGSTFFMPCVPGTPNSFAVTAKQIPSRLLLPPSFNFQNLLSVIGSSPSWQESDYDIGRFQDFKQSLGPAGMICELFPN